MAEDSAFSDDGESESSGDSQKDDDYVAGSDEDEDVPDDDSDDQDYVEKEERKTRSQRTTRRPKQVSYNEEESEEEDENDDDDEDYGAGRRGRKPAVSAGRPRRQAAQQANCKLKSTLRDEDDMDFDEEVEEDDDDDEGIRTRSKRATAGPSSGRMTRATRSRTGPKPAKASKGPKPQRASQRAVSKVSYVEASEDEGNSDAEDKSKKKKEPIAAFEDPCLYDDEVERILAHREKKTGTGDATDPWDSREFLVKWKRYSYIHCSWDTRATLIQLAGYKRVVNYMRKIDEQEAARKYCSREELELQDVERQMEEQLVEEHMNIERIIAMRPEDNDQPLKYLVKWQGLPYAECTWETEEDICKAKGDAKIEEYNLRESRSLEPCKKAEEQRKNFKNKGTRALEVQPEYLAFGKLRDYQLDGLNWLVYSWSQDRNCILADEMGLGKTVQCVSFLGYLSETLQMRGPFLVVVPLSTVPNWLREFSRWVPFMSTVVYVGDSRSREVLRNFEFELERKGNSLRKKFEVVITTYEVILKDANVLGKIKWNYMMVDEAHRLKNSESALYQELITWQFKNKLLITGTPLQNNIRELWALLHFLDPKKFPDADVFESQYSMDNADSLQGLHLALRPHLLRRVIKDVEKSLPPKNERILRVEMSPLQKQYYKWILTRNFKELNKGTKGGGHVSLLNIIAELKKCCNHPFLFESAEEGYRGSENDKSAVDRLVVTSGKMVLLDKLLKRLKQTGHRVLIFSQMVRALDVISDYMRMRGFQHQRLDGSTPAAARHQAMEHFNRPESPDFAFLLSTRAGGLGINLATADTVIIFDSDWNPQNDLQAMSRAHRIGQTETVNIYRFVTSGSVEEDILERAKKKMVLDHLVIQRMDTSGRTVLDPEATKNSAKQMFGKDELAAILRFGAEELFKGNEQENAEKEKRMYEEDIDAILERAEVVDNRGVEDTGGASDLLSSFNVASVKFQEDDAAFWNRLIPTTERPKDEPEELLPRSARLLTDEEPGETKKAAGPRAQRREHRAKKATGSGEPGPPVDGAACRVDEWPLDVDEQGLILQRADDDDPSVKTISRRDANAFVRAVRRYGLQSRLADIASEVGPVLEDAPQSQRLSLWHVLVDGCKRAVAQTTDEEQDAKDAILDFFGAAVKAQEFLTHLSHMRLLAKKVEQLKDPIISFRLDSTTQITMAKWAKLLNWTPRDDAALLLGVYYYGLGHWDKIAADPRLKLQEKLSCVTAVKDKEAVDSIVDKGLPKGTHLETRVLSLMKKIYTANKTSAPKGLLPPRPKAPPLRVQTARDSKDPAAGVKRKAPSTSRDKIRESPEKRVKTEKPDVSKRQEKDEVDCKQLLEEVIVEVRKLRKLQDSEMSQGDKLQRIKKYLLIIGQHVEKVVHTKGNRLRLALWEYIAKHAPGSFTGEKLERLYIQLKARQSAAKDKVDERDGATAQPSNAAAGGKSETKQERPQTSHQESGEIVEVGGSVEQDKYARGSSNSKRQHVSMQSDVSSKAAAALHGYKPSTSQDRPDRDLNAGALEPSCEYDARTGARGAGHAGVEEPPNGANSKSQAPSGPPLLKLKTHKTYFSSALEKPDC